MNYSLPKSLNIGGAEYEIRSDFRAALDICAALSDDELSEQERGYTVLSIFYPDFDKMPEESYTEAIERLFWFLRGGEEERPQKGPQLVSWEQDFNLICPAVNRIVGCDVRGLDYMHWWTWQSAYMEIGDCFFAQVVGIRSKKAKGKPLDKQDKEFYRRNRDLIDIKKPHTDAERNILKEWM